MNLEFNNEEEKLEYLMNGINEYQASIDQQNRDVESKQGLFLIRPANDWINLAKNRPTPNRLYFDFWFEYELCCLFASSNVGKSILAVQIAVKIAETQKILYFDMELSSKQFEGRIGRGQVDAEQAVLPFVQHGRHASDFELLPGLGH